jgi:hypothetical protein
MISVAHVSHQTSGRLRVKIPSKKGNSNYFEAVKSGFAGLGGIDDIQVNHLTGSVLFLLKGASEEAIASHALSRGIFKLHGKSSSTPAGLQQRLSGTFKGMNDQIKSLTGNELDIAGSAFLVLIGAGIYEISRGNFTAPAWYTAFWYALNILLKSNKGIEAA